MIKKFLVSLVLTVALLFSAQAEDHSKNHSLDLTPQAPIGNMTKVISLHGTIFMTGQPSPDTLKSLPNDGFNVVINIRAADEINFDEPAIVKKGGMTYYNIPLMKAGKIQDSAVTEIHEALMENKGKKILLHCSSGNRVAGWLGAHLARDMGYDTEVAVASARKGGMTKDSMERILRDYLANLKK
ncbi:MAG: sulfur transferase domain-containing protein [Emcibacter sp.]|nr:sulfur transferase domain-containing protein [Emcibacter sp.]